jgi:hypothetical protein
MRRRHHLVRCAAAAVRWRMLTRDRSAASSATTRYVQCTGTSEPVSESGGFTEIAAPPPPDVNVWSTSSSTEGGGSYKTSAGVCPYYYLPGGSTWAGSPSAMLVPSSSAGTAACDIQLPDLGAAGQCYIYLQTCGCVGDTFLSIPSARAFVDDDALQVCGPQETPCSTGYMVVNYTAARVMRLQQSCFSAESCGGTASWSVYCIAGTNVSSNSSTLEAVVSTAAVANFSAGSSESPTPATPLVSSGGDYEAAINNPASVGVEATVGLVGYSSTTFKQAKPQFLKGVAASLSLYAADSSPDASRVVFLSATEYAVPAHRRKLHTFRPGVRARFSVLADNPDSGGAIARSLNASSFAATLYTGLQAAGMAALTSTSLLAAPVIGPPVVLPVTQLRGVFNVTTRPLPADALVFGSYPREQCIQARPGAVFMRKDSLTLSTSASAFALTVTASATTPLAIGFYVWSDGEASLEDVTDFYVLKQNGISSCLCWLP